MGRDKPNYQELEDQITELKLQIEILKLSGNSDVLSDARYRKMIGNIGDVIVIIDSKGLNKYKSPNIEKHFGWKPEDVIGKSTLANVHPKDLEFSKNFIATLISDPNVVKKAELRYKCKDGSYRWIEFSCCNLLHDPDIKGLLGNYHDITERKQYNELLEEKIITLTQPLDNIKDIDFHDLFSLKDLQKLQDDFSKATGVASIITYPDGSPITKPSNFTFLCNDIIRKTEKGCVNCYKSDAIIGKYSNLGPTIQTCFSGGLWDAGAGISVGGNHVANWLIGQVRNESQTEEGMINYAEEIGADKKSFLEAFYLVPAMSKEKFENIAKALYTLSSQLSISAYQNVQQARFILERKQSEEALLKSKEKYHSIFNNVIDVYYESSLEGELLEVSPSIEIISKGQYKPNDLIGKSMYDFYPNTEEREMLLKKLKEKGSVYDFEITLKNRDGSMVSCSISSKILFSEQGQITKIIGSMRDISKRKQFEKELIAAKQIIEESEARFKALHNASFGGIAIHDKGIILECNYGLSEMTGYELDELIGMNGLLLIAEQSMELVKNNISKGYEKPYEAIGVKKNGDEFPMRLEARNVPYKGKMVRTVEFRDITEQKKAELEIIKAKEKAEESEQQLKLIANNFVNGMIYQVVMLDENKRKFNYVSDTVLKLYGCTAKEAMENSDLIYGKIHPDDIDLLVAEEKIALKNMSVFNVEARAINPDGSIRWSYYVSKPRIINGFVCWDGIEVDISERKKMEIDLKISKEKAEESDRLKSAFLANMSHEIRTPMNGILGFADLLKKPDLTGEQQQKYISIIEKGGARMLNIINDIVSISKIESGQMEFHKQESNINEQIEFIYTFFKPEVEDKKIQFTYRNPLPSNEAFIKTDREKIYAILTNLVKNAIKYTDHGSIEIGYNKKDNFLEFYVKDTGIGVPKDRQEAIFERFIQADIADKNAYQGAGLGLSISKAYIEILGGEIWIESEEGKGSAFYFTLPYKTQTKVETIAKKEILSSNQTASIIKLKMLIVEDDETSLELILIAVKKIGKEILNAATGSEAVEICMQNPDIDLVLMDIQLPEMNGYEATKQIRKFNKDVIIIAQTAYALSGDREKAIAAGCDDYISKPINSEELILKITELFKNR